MKFTKLDDTNSKWTYFGLLEDVYDDPNMLFVSNEDGDTRKMSKRKYRQAAFTTAAKAKQLKGTRVEVRTSQVTKDWSTATWFSDIRKAGD